MTTPASALAYRKQQSNWRKRREEMRKLRDQGWSFTKIGEKFLISRQRAEQVVNDPH